MYFLIGSGIWLALGVLGAGWSYAFFDGKYGDLNPPGEDLNIGPMRLSILAGFATLMAAIVVCQPGKWGWRLWR